MSEKEYNKQSDNNQVRVIANLNNNDFYTFHGLLSLRRSPLLLLQMRYRTVLDLPSFFASTSSSFTMEAAQSPQACSSPHIFLCNIKHWTTDLYMYIYYIFLLSLRSLPFVSTGYFACKKSNSPRGVNAPLPSNITQYITTLYFLCWSTEARMHVYLSSLKAYQCSTYLGASMVWGNGGYTCRISKKCLTAPIGPCH